MNQLLPNDMFRDMFEPLAGMKVGYVGLGGLLGNQLTDWAAEQLFEYFGVPYTRLNWMEGPKYQDHLINRVNVMVFAGENFLFCPQYHDIYRRYFRSRRPKYLFPQTLVRSHEDFGKFKTVFLRDQRSQKYFPDGVLVPDLSLAFSPPKLDLKSDIQIGIFIREDDSNVIGMVESSLGDPEQICDTVIESLMLAGRCETIYTDKLHFAVCGLIAGRTVHLLADSSGKNKCVYDAWLADLGCHWCGGMRHIPDVPLDKNAHLYKSIALPRSQQLDWDLIPKLTTDLENQLPLMSETDQTHCSENGVEFSALGLKILALIDGSKSLDEIIKRVVETHGSSTIDAARDVAHVVRFLRDEGSLVLEKPNSKNLVGFNRPKFIRRQGYCELTVDPPNQLGNLTRYQASFCFAAEEPRTIWFEAESTDSDVFADRADPFVLLSLLPAMHRGADLYVQGAGVSAGLLQNLHEFQSVFTLWYPYLKPVRIFAEQFDSSAKAESGIIAYSGGVDSLYSLLRQLHNPPEQWNHHIDAAVMVRGFDVLVTNYKQFSQVVERARLAIGENALEILTVNTNAREFYSDWKSYHGTCLAAVLSLFTHRFDRGMVASTIPYNQLYPFGSNALTDRMLGSNEFQIIHDGAELVRLDKLKYLSGFPAATRYMRFCWRGNTGKGNCGKCGKCMVNWVLLTALGCPNTCFNTPVDPKDVVEYFDQSNKSCAIDLLDCRDLERALQLLPRKTVKPPWASAVESRLEHIRKH